MLHCDVIVHNLNIRSRLFHTLHQGHSLGQHMSTYLRLLRKTHLPQPGCHRSTNRLSYMRPTDKLRFHTSLEHQAARPMTRPRFFDLIYFRQAKKQYNPSIATPFPM